MAVDGVDGVRVRDGNMVGLDAHNLSILFVSLVDGQVAATTTALVQQPEVRERGGHGARHAAETWIAEIREEEVQHSEEQECIGRKGRKEDHGGQMHPR